MKLFSKTFSEKENFLLLKMSKRYFEQSACSPVESKLGQCKSVAKFLFLDKIRDLCLFSYGVTAVRSLKEKFSVLLAGLTHVHMFVSKPIL